jgi:hypothetical protein
MSEMRIELARDSDAADFERFVGELGLQVVRQGATVEILEESELIGEAVTAWLSDTRDQLVPTTLADGSLALRPPAA